jgi:hypothetical protein
MFKILYTTMFGGLKPPDIFDSATFICNQNPETLKPLQSYVNAKGGKRTVLSGAKKRMCIHAC